jgi:hypothetical protein
MKLFSRMKWQDAIFATGEVVFMIGLLPSVFSDNKPAALTSLATAIMLMAFLLVHASYKLWMAFILCSGTIILWWILFVQVAFS